MKQQNPSLLALCLVALFTCLNISVMAQSPQNDGRLATVVADSSLIRWESKGPYSRMVLTVSAPSGQLFRQEFPSDSPASFSLANRPDGNYLYELRVTPAFSQGVREGLVFARERGDDSLVEQEMKSRGLLPPESHVQFGSFSLEKGLVFLGSSEITEPRSVARGRHNVGQTPLITPNDVVNADDFIVQGSLCVGLDCVDGESFGFDTIRLKENNTRIKFEDTSTSAGFPTSDWQITANDSASGGSNKFSIDDVDGATTPFTITAGAPTNSFFLSSTGHLGLRTNTPALDLHLNTGNTPAFRFEQNGTGGFTPQTWDIGANEANFFVRDLTGASRLPFRIRPGAPTSSIDINSSGDVGIGTASPTSRLTVNGLLEITNPGSATPFGIKFPDGLIQASAGVSDSLHIMGSSGSIDEDSISIASLSNFVAGVRDGSTGTANLRYNLPATANLSTIGSAFRAFRIRFRDSDGPGVSARVLLTVHSTDINTGGNSTIFTFDSNNETSTGLGFVTLTKCDNTAATDFDFSTKGFWIEASVTRSGSGDLVQLGHLQIFKTNTCP